MAKQLLFYVYLQQQQQNQFYIKFSLILFATDSTRNNAHPNAHQLKNKYNKRKLFI